jgi:hypothetical protein
MIRLQLTNRQMAAYETLRASDLSDIPALCRKLGHDPNLVLKDVNLDGFDLSKADYTGLSFDGCSLNRVKVQVKDYDRIVADSSATISEPELVSGPAAKYKSKDPIEIAREAALVAKRSGAIKITLDSTVFSTLEALPQEFGDIPSLKAFEIVHGGALTDLSSLLPLNGLREISVLKGNRIELAQFEKFSRLAVLRLAEGQFENFGFLTHMTSLTELVLNRVVSNDLSPLSALVGLRKLHLEGARIVDLSPLSRMTSMVDLNLKRSAVQDLTPLSRLTNLRKLRLERATVSDLTPLSHMSDLTELNLNEAIAEDLSPLAGMTEMRILSLNWSMTKELTPLADMTALIELNLNHALARDLTPLSGMIRLKKLDLHNSTAADLSPLSNMVGLKWLTLNNTRTKDLKPLSRLTALEKLNLDNALVKDLAPLAKMTSLVSLDLHNASVKDLSPLSGMKSLKKLGISNVQATDMSPVLGLDSLEQIILPRRCRDDPDVVKLASRNIEIQFGGKKRHWTRDSQR